MIEKKNPDQKTDADDSSDDEPIIELTDEVIIEPEEDRKPPSQKTDDFIPPTADQDLSFEDDEDILVFDENAKLSIQDDPFIEAEGQISDDAIEMTGDETRNNFDDNIELEFENGGEEIDFFAGDDEQSEDDSVLAIPSEISPTLGTDDNGIDMLSDIDFEGEEDEEIMPLDELDKVDVEPDDDIIEIAEFDQHFPDDDDDVLEHAGHLDPSGLEDEDFLELFDSEEESPMEDEEMRELSESEENAVEAELSRFFDDALEDETGTEKKVSPPAEEFSELDTDLDLAMTAAALSSGSGKIEPSNTPSLQDPPSEKELASFAKDQSEKGAYMQIYSPESKAGDFPVASPEQIDQAIERIVNEKLAGRIEHIIYEIIEKAVKREIDRLKASLFEDSTPEDDL